MSEKQGSFADPNEYADKPKPKPEQLSITCELNLTLQRIATAIEENTKATNALTSTFVSELRKDKQEPLLPANKPSTQPPLPKPEPEPTPTTQPTTQAQAPTTWDALKVFEPRLANLLNFEDLGDNVRIKPKQFLGSENFAKIAAVTRELGGKYVSAGKDSHFIIPKPK